MWDVGGLRPFSRFDGRASGFARSSPGSRNSARRRPPQERRCDERVDHGVARVALEAPQPRRLCRRELETRHFDKFTLDAPYDRFEFHGRPSFKLVFPPSTTRVREAGSATNSSPMVRSAAVFYSNSRTTSAGGLVRGISLEKLKIAADWLAGDDRIVRVIPTVQSVDILGPTKVSPRLGDSASL